MMMNGTVPRQEQILMVHTTHSPSIPAGIFLLYTYFYRVASAMKMLHVWIHYI